VRVNDTNPFSGEGQGEGECLPFLLLERVGVMVDVPRRGNPEGCEDEVRGNLYGKEIASSLRSSQ
jgi:hypothetical protein